MRSGSRFLMLTVLVVGLLIPVIAPAPAEACGYVKCEPPGSGGCWECTYSLYLFQRCKYWCKKVPTTGATHSSCWVEECFMTVEEEGPEALQLAALGVPGQNACPANLEEETEDHSAAPSAAEIRGIQALRLLPRT